MAYGKSYPEKTPERINCYITAEYRADPVPHKAVYHLIWIDSPVWMICQRCEMAHWELIVPVLLTADKGKAAMFDTVE